MLFTLLDLVKIWNYDAEHGPAATLQKFKAEFPEVKDSTIKYF